MFRPVGERTPLNSDRRNAKRRMVKRQSTVAMNVGWLTDFWEKVRVDPIEPLPHAARTAAQARSKQLKIDVIMLLTVITLLIFGILMLYSASYDYSFNLYDDPTRIFSRQLLWLALGSTLALTLAFFDYHRWRALAVPAMGTTVLLLLAVLLVNETRNGAVRTLLEGSVQPSELAKLVTIIYLSVWLYSKRDQLGDISFGLIPLAAILGLLGGLIAVQPDLSAVVTIFALGGLLFFLSGGEARQMLVLFVVALLVGLVVVQISATGSERIRFYMAGLRDPIQGSYHVRRALEAFVKGGWFGLGIGNSDTKLTGLPVPPTDSIFAVVGEETGVLGATALVALYVVFLWRGLAIARRAPDILGSLMAAGLTLWISMEAFINMAVMVNLAPFAGNALPFISAGGSNLIVTLAAVGILMNISRLSVQRKEANEKVFDAVVDLRRRDRRRRVPGSGGSAGAAK